MTQNYLRKIVRTNSSHHIDVEVPAEFGDQVEIIILPYNPKALPASEEESFNLAAYNALIEDDEQEDAIWSKYVRN